MYLCIVLIWREPLPSAELKTGEGLAHHFLLLLNTEYAECTSQLGIFMVLDFIQINWLKYSDVHFDAILRAYGVIFKCNLSYTLFTHIFLIKIHDFKVPSTSCLVRQPIFQDLIGNVLSAVVSFPFLFLLFWAVTIENWLALQFRGQVVNKFNITGCLPNILLFKKKM